LGFLYQIGEITRNLEKILSKLGNSTAGKMLLNTTKVNTFLGKYPGVLKVKTFFSFGNRFLRYPYIVCRIGIRLRDIHEPTVVKQ